jgi:S-adenosylmethionine:tRNA ribosyltransferase-isomerase
MGKPPLPPYIKRPADWGDDTRYQTVFAAKEGSIAAPTAGLHFTPELLAKLNTRRITLHVGLGTFKPVKAENVEDHKMHAEYYEIPEAPQGKVVAVGTTTCRTLETWARTGKLSGWTDLFVTPGFEFKVVKSLVTNFHVPKSTLLMLVCALAGRERILDAYAEAVREKYRFFSYGDAMLIL